MKRIIYANPVLKTVYCTPCRTIAQVSSIEGGSGENYGTSDGTWDGSTPARVTERSPANGRPPAVPSLKRNIK